MIGRRFAGRIRRVRRIRRVFAERAVGAERPINLIGRHVMKAKVLAPGRGQAVEITASRLQPGESAAEIGIDEGGWRVDRAVDMGFGRKMEHRVWLMSSEDAVERRRIADV